MRASVWSTLCIPLLCLAASDASAEFRPSGRRRPAAVQRRPPPNANARHSDAQNPKSVGSGRAATQAPDRANSTRAKEEITLSDEDLVLAFLENPGVSQSRNEILERAKVEPRAKLLVALLSDALPRTKSALGRAHVLRLLRKLALGSDLAQQALDFDEQLTATSPNESPAERVEFLRDLSRTELRRGQATLAQAHLLRALEFARHPGERRELESLLVEASLQAKRFDAVIDHFKSLRIIEAPRYRLLARLYAESNQLPLAIETLRNAPPAIRADRELALQLYETLELAGNLDEAERELSRLVRRYPSDLKLAQTYFERLLLHGDRREAANVLSRIERNLTLSPGSTATLADAWERLGDSDRAARLLKRLGPLPRRAHSDVSAETTTTNAGKVHALSHLDSDEMARIDSAVEDGDVELATGLLDHLLLERPHTEPLLVSAAKSYERAAIAGKKPDDALYQKAESIWIELIESAQTRETSLILSVEHVVRLWAIRGVLELRTDELRKRVGQTPTGYAQCLWLAEAETRRGRFDSAMKLLESWLLQAPNSQTVLSRLERLAARAGTFDRALEYARRRIAEGATPTTPDYRTLIEYAFKSKNHNAAIEYAEQWTRSEPNSTSALAELARVWRRVDEKPKALLTLRQATNLDANRFDLLLELATWQIEDNERETVLDDLLRVLERDRNEQRLYRAYQLALPVAAQNNQLPLVEHALRSAQAKNPTLQTVRDALLELYEQLLPSSADNPIVATPMRARALRTLLDGLDDPRESINDRALRLLARYPSRASASVLFSFAKRHENTALGERAVWLLASLREPRIERLLLAWFSQRTLPFTDGGFAYAVLYCINQLETTEANAALSTLVRRGSTGIRIYSAIALGTRSSQASVPLLVDTLEMPDTPSSLRAALLLALDELTPESLPIQKYITLPRQSTDRLALIAVLSHKSPPNRNKLIAQLLCEGSLAPELTDAASQLGGARRRSLKQAMRDPKNWKNPAQMLLAASAVELDSKSNFATLQLLAPELADACRKEAALSEASAILLGRQLWNDAEPLSLSQWVPNDAPLSAQERLDWQSTRKQFLRTLAEGFEGYLNRPDPELRRIALGMVAVGREDEAAIVTGLQDPDERLRENALVWTTRAFTPKVEDAMLLVLNHDESPRLRSLAAFRFGKLPPSLLGPKIQAAFVAAARNDPIATVRLNVLTSMKSAFPVVYHRELSYALSADTEPENRKIARKLLEGKP